MGSHCKCDVKSAWRLQPGGSMQGLLCAPGNARFDWHAARDNAIHAQDPALACRAPTKPRPPHPLACHRRPPPWRPLCSLLTTSHAQHSPACPLHLMLILAQDQVLLYNSDRHFLSQCPIWCTSVQRSCRHLVSNPALVKEMPIRCWSTKCLTGGACHPSSAQSQHPSNLLSG